MREATQRRPTFVIIVRVLWLSVSGSNVAIKAKTEKNYIIIIIMH